MEQVILTGVLILFVVMLFREILAPELTALLVLLVLTLLSELETGLHFLSLTEAVQGFSNSAVLTIAGMFVMSAGLSKTGVVEVLGNWLLRFSRGSQWRVLLLSTVSVAAMSSFINNTPIVVLFVPLILRVSFEYGISPSKLLIPVSYASILGGTCTLIGTSTNLIIASVVAEYISQQPDIGLKTFGLYEFTIVGVPIALLGLIVIFLLSPKLLPDRKVVSASLHDIKQKIYVTELRINADSPAIGKSIGEAFFSADPPLQVMEVLRGEDILYPPVDDIVLRSMDRLVVRGNVRQLLKVLSSRSAELAPELNLDGVSFAEKKLTLAELLILPGSDFIGLTLSEARLKQRFDVSVMAILRQGQHFHSGDQVQNMRLRLGDMLLIQGSEDALKKTRFSANVLLLEGIEEAHYRQNRAPLSAAIFLLVIGLATFELLPIMLLSLVGAAAMVLTGCLRLSEAYQSLNTPVLLLIAASIGLGDALANTGTADLYASLVRDLLQPFGPLAVLAGLFLLTTLLTEFISNNATAIIMTHIAVATAIGLGVSPVPFVMAVLFGASACYATPIGYQTNLFVHGAGGYRFSDFMRLGLIMNALVFLVAMTLIPLVWPF